MIDALHFIRPLWLLAIPAVALTWWLVRRRDASQARVGSTAPAATRCTLRGAA